MVRGRIAGRAPQTESRTPVPVDIRDVGSAGEGIGRLPDGRVVFVPRAAPGDLLRVRIVREHRRRVEAEIVSIERPGPDRRVAPCRSFDACGGCSLQHLTAEAQRTVRRARISEALRRIGGIGIEVPEIRPAPSEWGYRTRMTFTVRRLGAGRIVAGLHHRGDPGRIVDVGEWCLLPTPRIREVWEALRSGWGEGGALLPRGRSLRLHLREITDGVALGIEGGEGGGDPEALRACHPGLHSVWRIPGGGGEAVRVAGSGRTGIEVSGRRIRTPPFTFTQVNEGAARLLREELLEWAGEVRGLRVVDGYCGLGIYGRILAERGAEVVGIELDPAASGSGEAPGFRIRIGRVERLLPEELPAGLVILNPPRGGLDPEVCRILTEQPEGRILYVSCDPATLARDAARLAPSWALSRIAGWDLFPQTPHVESLAEFRPRNGAPRP